MCQQSILLFRRFSLTISLRMGVFIMRNFISNLFRFSTISLAIVGFFAPLSSAQANAGGAGLTSVGFIIDQSQMPPVRSDLQYVSCGSEIENDINRNYNYEPFQQCPNDLFMIHLSGFVTVPEGTQTVTFWLAHDDGATLQVGDQPLNDWWFDTGCSWDIAPEIQVVDLTMPLDVWLYEYGGDTCLMLGWQLDGQALAIVPDSAFTQTLAVVPTTTTTTTTTLPPYFNAVENLTAIANENGSVDLDWDAPTASNVDIYAYGVTFYGLDEIGGTTLNGWGVWTDQGTNYSLADYMFSGTTGFGPVRFGIKAGNQSCFSSEGVGPCAYGPEVTVDVTVLDPTSPTTTTTEPEPETTTTTEPEPETTTTTEPEPETTTTTEPDPETTTTTEPEIIPPVVIPPDTDPPVDDTEPEIIVPEPEVTEPEIIIPEPEVIEPEPETTVPEEISDQVDEILSGDLTEEEFSNAVDEILTTAENEEELVAAATELLSGDLSEEQFTEVIDQVFAEELSDEAFAEVLDTVFEEPLSDEEFTAVIDAVLDQPLSDEQFENLVDVLSSDTVTDEQVQEAVDAIIENGITEDQATEIATSAEVLSSIDGEQAAEIFAEIPIDNITEEQALEIIAAVQDAPEEVRSSFEGEINIFGSGSLNTYVPLGSTIDVGQRRAVIAAGAVIAAAPAAGAAGGSRRRK